MRTVRLLPRVELRDATDLCYESALMLSLVGPKTRVTRDELPLDNRCNVVARCSGFCCQKYRSLVLYKI